MRYFKHTFVPWIAQKVRSTDSHIVAKTIYSSGVYSDEDLKRGVDKEPFTLSPYLWKEISETEAHFLMLVS